MLEPQPARPLRAGRQLTRALGAAFAAVVALGGCTTRADFERLKDDVGEMRAHVADLQVSVDSLMRKVDTVNESAGAGGRQRQLEERLRQTDHKLAELENRMAMGGVPTPPAFGEGGPSPTAVARVPGSEAASLNLPRELQSAALPESFRRALQLQRDGQAAQAIQAFRDFLRANPKSPMAGNAQYWVGEAYFAQGDYNRSVIELNEVLVKYPQNDRLPGVLLALASAFEQQGDRLDAKLVLQKLISEYPKSEEAEIARRKLPSLGE